MRRSLTLTRVVTASDSLEAVLKSVSCDNYLDNAHCHPTRQRAVIDRSRDIFGIWPPLAQPLHLRKMTPLLSCAPHQQTSCADPNSRATAQLDRQTLRT